MDGKLPLVVTMGDPAGIGPEVALRSLADSRAREAGPVLLVGSRNVFDFTARRLGLGPVPPSVAGPGELAERGLPVAVLDAAPVRFCGEFGELRADLSAAAARSVEVAAELVLSGSAAGVVTAPLSKEGLALAGRGFPGHTEMLAAICGSSGGELMLLVGGGLRVALVTTHLAIAEVPAAVTAGRIGRCLDVLAAGLALDFGLTAPRIGVLALNPHGGEGGRFGTEELTRIGPAVAAACGRGLPAVGPLPADSAFHRALTGEFDAVLAMYHDQGLAVLKTLAFDTGVNVTLGLPVVRTSPDHGTAYGIAGKGVASPNSMIEAVRLAREIAGRRSARDG